MVPLMSGWYGSMHEFGSIDPGPGGGPVVQPPPPTPIPVPPLPAPTTSRVPGWMNQRNAKLAGMGLVAGAAVGMVVVPFLANRKIISKSKTWQVASVGAAIATPLVAAYA